jgi:SAM-dependent methyltransferase
MVAAMTAAPDLTDLTALARHRARALRAPALFLHQMAADDLQDRLSEVNRTFTRPAIVTPFAQVWAGRFSDAVIVPPDEVLSLEPQAHDLVIHAMALHWANDPVGQIIQCAQALRPDGLFLAALLGGQTLNELRSVLAQAESQVTGGLSPRVVPMAEIRDLGGLLSRAGLALPVADAAHLTASYRDIFHLAQDLRAMGETNALSGRLRRPASRGLFALAQTLYAGHFPHEGGRIRASFETIFLTGWKPHESQPRPLRPGSARHRLADALGVAEQPAKDPPHPVKD